MVEGEIKALDRRVTELKNDIEVLRKEIQGLKQIIDNFPDARVQVSDLNNRVREAMDMIARRFEIPLGFLFDPVMKR